MKLSEDDVRRAARLIHGGVTPGELFAEGYTAEHLDAARWTLTGASWQGSNGHRDQLGPGFHQSPDETDESHEREAAMSLWASTITGNDLHALEAPPMRWLVPGVLPLGGVVGLSGPPKAGKTIIAKSLGAAVAGTGDRLALGRLVAEHHGPVLFVSLDDVSPARAKRHGQLVAGRFPDRFVHRFEPVTLADIRAMLRYAPDCPILVMIDTGEHLRPRRDPADGPYTADVKFMAQVRELAAEFPATTLLLLAHTRKPGGGTDDDPISGVSGTHGLTGGMDHVLRIAGARHSPRRLLEAISRDADDAQWALGWSDDAGWVITDEDPTDPTLTMTPDDARVYRAVRDFGAEATAQDLAEVLPDMANIGNRLGALARRGYLIRVGRGTYQVAERTQ